MVTRAVSADGVRIAFQRQRKAHGKPSYQLKSLVAVCALALSWPAREGPIPADVAVMDWTARALATSYGSNTTYLLPRTITRSHLTPNRQQSAWSTC